MSLSDGTSQTSLFLRLLLLIQLAHKSNGLLTIFFKRKLLTLTHCDQQTFCSGETIDPLDKTGVQSSQRLIRRRRPGTAVFGVVLAPQEEAHILLIVFLFEI
jgi:hypothetical protein